MKPCNLPKPKRRKAGKEKQNSPAAGNSQKKRKSTGKSTTPRKGASKNSTPKKNVSDSPGSARKIDLQLEAKLSAEENSRMFSGCQIHPFFSKWRVERKIEEPIDSEHSLSTAKRKRVRITIDPIHVFENVQDDASSLDWSDWTFLEKTTVVDSGPQSSNLSVFEDSAECLNFDNFLRALKHSSASISKNALSCTDQLCIQTDNMLEISPANSAVLANEQTICPSRPEDARVDLEVNHAITFSGHEGIFRKSDTKPLSRFLQESMRSYYHSCEDKAENSLWIHKYKPTKAVEVCGNDEALNFLRDWLRLWHERRYQGRKGSSNRDQSDMQKDDDYNCSDSDYDPSKDTDEEDSLQNILLITGPVGSGKSAAVYACAQEIGLEVKELNASNCRNGAVVKQDFGGALESYRFKSLLDHAANPHEKTVKLLPAPALPNGKAAEEMDDGVIELITISDDGAHSPGGTSPGLHGKTSVLTHDRITTLILVEDVDILFPEDRGCIAAIQQIAETSKGPIILTSNSNNASLPDNVARLHVSFTMPLPDELLCHLYMVCVKEEVNINPLLLEKFIHSCDGDIRKTIMQLQFWFQSKKYRKNRKVQMVYGSLPFDLHACHQIIPKILPWNYPSELSELIEKEVAESMTIMEENSCLQGLVNSELCTNERQNALDEQLMRTDYLEDKAERIKRNRSRMDCNDFESQHGTISELSSCSRSPVTSSWPKDQRKCTVISSDSEDKDPNNRHSKDIHDEAYKRRFLEGNSESPKSIFVPEIVIQNRINPMSESVSSGCLAGPKEVSSSNELTPFTFNVCHCLGKLPQNSDSLGNTEIPESSPKAAVQDFRGENTKTTIVYGVKDECGHDDLKWKSKIVNSSPSMETDMEQNLWRKLRICRTDLRQRANSEQLGVIQVVKLTSGLTNLISEADLLFRNHQQKQCGIMEPPMSLSDEDTFSWYDDLMMMSTVVIHGFSFYAQHISDVGSKLGCNNKVDPTSEILACTTNVMALGKLSRQDHTESVSIYTKRQLEVNNPINDTKRSSLVNVIRSMVPARSSLAMKGLAFNEYLSSLRQISISEGFRISQGVGKTRKRRTRGGLHYLSRGTMLSPEDISLMCESDLYRMTSSQYAANMKSNCT